MKVRPTPHRGSGNDESNRISVSTCDFTSDELSDLHYAITNLIVDFRSRQSFQSRRIGFVNWIIAAIAVQVVIARLKMLWIGLEEAA